MSLFSEEQYAAARAETQRLQRELDISNADHIALWLEANIGDASLGWLACRIAEAHESAISTPTAQQSTEILAEKRAREIMNPGLDTPHHPQCRREGQACRRSSPPKTLRDEFAMAAITGCVLESGTAAWFAELAYRIADAMMAERAKGGDA